MTSVMPFIKDILIKRSKDILLNFLDVSSMNYNIKSVFVRYCEKIVAIQRQWRTVSGNNERRFELLVRLWDKEVEIMTNY